MTAYPSAYPPAEPPGAAGPPPLDQPHYGIGFVPGVVRGFRKYATFSGRASRSEYWWWYLGNVIVSVVLVVLALVLGLATSTDRGRTPGALAWPFFILLMIYTLAVIVPSIAVTVRRLHDSGNSGWLLLLVFIPYVGSVVQIVFGFLATSPNGLRFEADPSRAVLPPGMSAGPAPYGAPYGYAAPTPGYGAPPQGHGYPSPPAGYGTPPGAPDYSQPPTAAGYPPPQAYPPPPQAYPPPASPQDRPTDEQGYGRPSS